MTRPATAFEHELHNEISLALQPVVDEVFRLARSYVARPNGQELCQMAQLGSALAWLRKRDNGTFGEVLGFDQWACRLPPTKLKLLIASLVVLETSDEEQQLQRYYHLINTAQAYADAGLPHRGRPDQPHDDREPGGVHAGPGR